MQPEITQFRCPFEVKGRESGLILEVLLGEDHQKRIATAQKAFGDFAGSPKLVGIRFVLPKSVLKECPTFETLHVGLVPYQAELVAAEMDYRLDPLLPYQVQRSDKAKIMFAVTTNRDKAAAAASFLQMLSEMGIPPPKNVSELSVLLETLFMTLMERGTKNPTIMLFMAGPAGEQIFTLSITPAGVISHLERRDVANAAVNKNCIALVKCPFYPRAFARWSEDVEIYYSREADFTGVSPDARKRIRAHSNWVLQQHGVPIAELEGDKQPIGLWVPDGKK